VPMKTLIINTDYFEFLHWFYGQCPDLSSQSFDTQLARRMASLFGVADFYSRAFAAAGHASQDLILNNEYLQRAWLAENDKTVSFDRWSFRLRRGLFPWFSKVKDPAWMLNVLAAQLEYYQPDLILNIEMHFVPPLFWKKNKPKSSRLVGQISWIHNKTSEGNLKVVVPETQAWSVYDLVLSSFPTTIEYCQKIGVPAQLSRLAFEPSILNRFEGQTRDIPVSFIGAVGSGIHKSRLAWLNSVCSMIPVDVWTPSESFIPADSPIRQRLHGNAWGTDMYGVLNRSAITLNQHGDVPDHANNLRLYEATGMGCLLITDWKPDLCEILRPGIECVAYRSDEECVEQILYYQNHPDEALQIARAGQRRTLEEHNYDSRIHACLKHLSMN
ncbi:MAG TPA: glycosyltransferase, partial [Planctomycetaceae bacterium]|nr:glycosyltransferase [Planctomycetaceae bacterium]